LLGLRHVHVAEVGFPFVDACLGHTVFATKARDRDPCPCSFRLPMICSSLNRLRFVFGSSGWARTNLKPD
jgi:hypothetical protein